MNALKAIKKDGNSLYNMRHLQENNFTSFSAHIFGTFIAY